VDVTPDPAGDDQQPLTPDDPLTSKEGWRRFVDHHLDPPTPVTAADLLAMPARARAEHDDARVIYHADLPLVHTPTIRQALTTGRLLIQLNRHQVSARRGVILSGASGTGKTTALTQLGRTHERAVRRRNPDARHRLPVLYVTVPPAATPRMLAVEFARFFGLELSARANITDVVNAVCATAAATGVDLVCVDEIHNLNLATRAGAEVSDQLKYFAERLPATFVYAGIDVEAQGLFTGTRGRQIAGRFTLISCSPFHYLVFRSFGAALCESVWDLAGAGVEEEGEIDALLGGAGAGAAGGQFGLGVALGAVLVDRDLPAVDVALVAQPQDR